MRHALRRGNQSMYNEPNQSQYPYAQMKCSNCGAELPPGAAACPRCGTLTSQYTGGDMSQYDPTVAASYNKPGAIPPSPYGPIVPESPYSVGPSTAYGPNSYGTPPEYAAPSYGMPSPPPSPRPQRNRLAIVIGAGILVVILIGASLFAVLRLTSNNSSGNSTPPTATSTRAATATPNTAQNPYPPNTGTLIVNDPLTDNSKGYQWDESSFSGTDSCGFTAGAYHVVEKTGLICIPEAKNLTLANFAFEVNIKIVKGDNGGIAFRINQVNKTFYAFDIAPDGSYTLEVYTTKFTVLSQGTNSVIKKGLNASNLLAVVANGDLITIYVNDQIIDSVHDKTFSQGQIGVLSYAGKSGINDVVASDVRVWKL